MTPSPTGQVLHAEHLKRPASAAKVVDGQCSHVRSATVVAAALVYQPAEHGSLTAWHAAALFTGENVEPFVHS